MGVARVANLLKCVESRRGPLRISSACLRGYDSLPQRSAEAFAEYAEKIEIRG